MNLGNSCRLRGFSSEKCVALILHKGRADLDLRYESYRTI